MRIFRWCVVAVVVALLHGSASAQTQRRLALLSSADENLTAVVEATLTGEQGIKLVDRADLKRALAEQKLSLGGLVGHEHAVSVGIMVTADVLATMDPIESGGIAAVIFDAGTGRRLRDIMVAEKSAETTAIRLAAVIKEAVVKSNQPGGVTLCLLTVRNADLPREMSGLCEAAGALLERRLIESPTVAVLERSRLDQITRERSLPTAKEANNKLLASVNLIELQIGRGATPGQLRIVAMLSDQSGKQTGSVEVSSKPDAAAIAAAVVPAVLAKIGTAPSRATAADPVIEATRFIREARLRAAHRDWGGAIRAMETAHALDPKSIQVHAALARMLADAAFGWGDIREGQLSINTSAEDKTASFSMMRRATDALLSIASTPKLPDGTLVFDLPDVRATVTRQHQWLAKLRWGLRKVETGQSVQLELPRELLDVLPEYRTDFRRIRLEQEKPARFARVKDAETLDEYTKFLFTLLYDAQYIWNSEPGQWTVEAPPLLLEWLDVVKKYQPTPSRVSELFANSHDRRTWDYYQAGDSLGPPVPLSPEELKRLQALYIKMMEGSSAKIRHAAKLKLDEANDQLARLDRQAKNPEFSTRRATSVDGIKPPEVRPGDEPPPTPPAPKVTLARGEGFWEEYRVLIDTINNDSGYETVLDPVVREGIAYAVAIQRENWHTESATLLKIPLTDGKPVVVSKVTVAGTATMRQSRETDRMARLGRGHDRAIPVLTEKYFLAHVGTMGPVLFPLDGSKPVRITPGGDWPADRIQAATIVGDKLYIALSGSGAFLIEQAVSGGPAKVLASSARKEKLSPFDDLAPMRLTQMAPDSARNRIVFIASSPEWVEGLSGIYEFNLATGKFKQLVPTRAARDGDSRFGPIYKDRLPCFGGLKIVLNLRNDTTEPLPPQVVWNLPVAVTDTSVWSGMRRMLTGKKTFDTLPPLRGDIPKHYNWPSSLVAIDERRMLVADSQGLFVVIAPDEVKNKPVVSTAGTAPPSVAPAAGGKLPWSEAKPLYDFFHPSSEFAYVVSPVLKDDFIYALGIAQDQTATLLRFSINDGSMTKCSRVKMNGLVVEGPAQGAQRLWQKMQEFHNAEVTKDSYWIATTSTGLHIFPFDPNGEVRSVPAAVRQPRPVTVVGDEVYIAWGDVSPRSVNRLAKLDLNAKPQVQYLTNPRATVVKSPLDNVSPLFVTGIEGDAERQRVLFVVHRAEPDLKVNGLWQYSIATGEMKLILPLYLAPPLKPNSKFGKPRGLFRWSRRSGDTLLICLQQGLIAFDLKSDQAKVLCQAGESADVLDPEGQKQPDRSMPNDLLNGRINPVQLRDPVVLQGQWLWFMGGRVTLDGKILEAFPPERMIGGTVDYGDEFLAISANGRYRFTADQKGCWMFNLKD